MILDNWSIVTRKTYFCSKEICIHYLTGKVYSHRLFIDGEYVETSRIIGKIDDNTIVTESKSIYQLDSIDPEFARLFRPAKRRDFFAKLPLMEFSLQTKTWIFDAAHKTHKIENTDKIENIDINTINASP